MKRTLLAAITLTALVAIPAIADAAEGYATSNVNMRSGPSTSYPAVTVIPAGAPLEINGCLADVPWCDVSFVGGRGWVAGQYVQAVYQQRRVYVGPEYYRPLGIPTVVFNFDNYWDRYYRGRDFYRDRDRWRRGPGPGPGYGYRRPDSNFDQDWGRQPDRNWDRRPDRNRDWDDQRRDDNRDWGQQRPDRNRDRDWDRDNRSDRRPDNNRNDNNRNQDNNRNWDNNRPDHNRGDSNGPRRPDRQQGSNDRPDNNRPDNKRPDNNRANNNQRKPALKDLPCIPNQTCPGRMHDFR